MNDLSHTNETSARLDDTGCVAFRKCVFETICLLDFAIAGHLNNGG